MKGSVCDGVFFTEQPLEQGVVRGRVKITIQGQNSNLSKVKKQMARKATGMGASAIANFRYGQKRSFVFWDNMKWFGEGDAITID